MSEFVRDHNVRQVYDLIRRYGGAQDMAFDEFVAIAFKYTTVHK